MTKVSSKSKLQIGAKEFSELNLDEKALLKRAKEELNDSFNSCLLSINYLRLFFARDWKAKQEDHPFEWRYQLNAFLNEVDILRRISESYLSVIGPKKGILRFLPKKLEGARDLRNMVVHIENYVIRHNGSKQDKFIHEVTTSNSFSSSEPLTIDNLRGYICIGGRLNLDETASLIENTYNSLVGGSFFELPSVSLDDPIADTRERG